MVAVMLVVVAVTGARAMIVPEVAAVSAGLVVFQVASWRAQPVAFWLVIAGAAFAGSEVARYLHVALVWQIAVTLGGIALGLLFFRVPAWPALSAGLLPVYLHLLSPLYVVAVMVFMGVPVLVVAVLEHAPVLGYMPMHLQPRQIAVLAVTLGASVVLVALAGTPLVLLPPLLVAAAERAMVEPEVSEPRTTLARMVVLLVAIELSILGYEVTHSLYVVLATIVVVLALLTQVELELGPALALAVIPLVFSRATDARIAYLIPAGVVLTQVVPWLLAPLGRAFEERGSRSLVPKEVRSFEGGACDGEEEPTPQDPSEIAQASAPGVAARGARVVVLGGGSAIARAILEARVAQLAQVVLLGPHQERLEATAAALRARGPWLEVSCALLDLADEETIVPVLDRVLEALGGVEMVIVGAGVLEEREDPAAVSMSIKVNFLGPAIALAHLAPRVSDGGQIVVLSSVAGERVRHTNYVYGAAKAGLDGYALALGERLRGRVRLLVVRPGFVHSPMTAGRRVPPLATTPERVARDVVRVMEQGRALVWSPPLMRVVMSGFRHLPRGLARRVPL
jgi:decaprenylphospho-beta-D-erythro-pentofuranosid-2-ulose 2-reductase